MHRELGQELDVIPLYEDGFKNPTHEKGMHPEGLPGEMNEDDYDGVCPASKGTMIRESSRQWESKKKKGTK